MTFAALAGSAEESEEGKRRRRRRGPRGCAFAMLSTAGKRKADGSEVRLGGEGSQITSGVDGEGRHVKVGVGVCCHIAGIGS